MTERVIDPRQLTSISFAASSHNHTDHFDPETIRAVHQANPAMRLVVPEANSVIAGERLGVDSIEVVGLDDGKSVIVDGIEIHGIAAAHNDLARDSADH